MFEIANRFVDPVLLLVVQRGIEPTRRVFRIELPRQLQLMRGVAVVSRIAERLGEVAAQHGAVRFQRSRRAQVFPPGRCVTAANPAQAASKPRVRERGVHENRFVKLANGRGNLILRAEQKSFQGQRRRVAWRQRERFLQRGERLVHPAKTEFQFRHARAGETEIRRGLRGLARGGQRALEIHARLLIIRFRHPGRRAGRSGRVGKWFVVHGRDQFAQRTAEPGRLSQRIQYRGCLIDFTDNQHQRGPIYFFSVRGRLAIGGIGVQRRHQIAAAISGERCAQGVLRLIGPG